MQTGSLSVIGLRQGGTMERILLTFGWKRFLHAAAGVVMANAPAVAQQSDRDSGAEQVIVLAPYMERERLAPDPASRYIPRERVSYNIPVSYADLDLTNPSDVAKLEARINVAAQEGCRQLDQHFPPTIYAPDTINYKQDCVKRAVEGALAKVRTIVASR
jgi:UrcA family protein